MTQNLIKIPSTLSISYAISLLPIISKLLKKLLLQKLIPAIVGKSLILNHQFGFRSEHTTVEQIHRIINKIILAFETREYCSAMFLDVSGRLSTRYSMMAYYKIQQSLPEKFHAILKSYLSERYFFIKQHDDRDPRNSIRSPSDKCSWSISVHLLYTADLLADTNVSIAIWWYLQRLLTKICICKVTKAHRKLAKTLRTWRIKVNSCYIHYAYRNLFYCLSKWNSDSTKTPSISAYSIDNLTGKNMELETGKTYIQ